ncbi:SMAD/FHA domain-containing protein [Lasiosphaeria ovina]|uniref:SMAD/FHA domain-containing protein n=1 Tax=Lasiosphaeria ovina TaxID=92902 RepID=A0AAE0KH31_9PEZI|nr:SMAD/FHA domain-containing protein [Lasiosphaeria ovina]
MGSRSPEGGHRSRRTKYADDAPDGRDGGRNERKDGFYDKKFDDSASRRNRSRDRNGRKRSRTPDPGDRRSQSRERAKRRDRDGDRNRDRGMRRDGDRSSERAGRHHRSFGRDRPRQRSKDSKRSRGELRREEDDKPDRPDNKRSIVKRSGPLPSQGDTFAISNGEEPEIPKEKPNFGNSGALAAASNSVAQADGSTITLKYHEPPEARKPPPRDVWKMFVFKDSSIVDTVELSLRSCWLVGRDSAVVDLLAEHPTISSQHAVIQFRYTEKRNEFGDKIGRVKPYLIDLESANGTSLNNEKVPESRYLELRSKDMVKFGLSTREYVLVLAPKE